MNTLLDELDVPFTFRVQTSPLSGDLRIAWRVSLVLLVLLHSRARRASLQKLHVVNWASRTPESRELFLRFMRQTATKDELNPRIGTQPEPRHRLCYRRGLVSHESGSRLKLTPRGQNAAEEIDQTADCLSVEKNFLQDDKAVSYRGEHRRLTELGSNHMSLKLRQLHLRVQTPAACTAVD